MVRVTKLGRVLEMFEDMYHGTVVLYGDFECSGRIPRNEIPYGLVEHSLMVRWVLWDEADSYTIAMTQLDIDMDKSAWQ